MTDGQRIIIARILARGPTDDTIEAVAAAVFDRDLQALDTLAKVERAGLLKEVSDAVVPEG